MNIFLECYRPFTSADAKIDLKRNRNVNFLMCRDSYWVVKGLLATNMTTTVKHVLQNFLYILKE